MRKSELVSLVAKKCKGLNQKEVEMVIEKTCEAIVDVVVNNGEEVSLPFGKFKQKINAAKTGKNPLTGKEMNVPESHTMSFKSSKTIKKVIENKPKKGKK